MTIRTRLTLWFSGILLAALAAMGVLCYSELVLEPRERAAHAATLSKEESQESDAADLLGILAGCGLPALALSVGGGWWMTRKALTPVANLTQAVETLDEHNLGGRLPRSGDGDELDRLTEVFNAMTQRLEQSFQRIREFTLHASHELKTPLTVLRGEVETALQEDVALSPAQRQRLESELDELERLTKIVDGLTLLTKADAGLVTLDLQPVALDELVRDSFADALILAQPDGLRANLARCEPASVRGDRHRLRQLLLNLVDNAVKYNQPGGSLHLALRNDGQTAELTVANTGPGLCRESRARVFDRFFRGDPAHNSEVDGCGLGLSIAQWIVSVHKGSIQMDSAPGELTTVTVRLPLLRVPPEPEAAAVTTHGHATSNIGHLLLAVLLFAGCVRFSPKKLSPETTAQQFEARSLTNGSLRLFLEKNLHRELTNWPVATWDLDTLTLAAFYYHPSLEVARADWRVATSGMETARERPNPTATWSAIYEPASGAYSPWIPGLVFDLPLETAGKRRLRTDQARHLSDSARFNLATAAWQVRSQLRAALLDFTAAARRVELIRDQAAKREEFISRLGNQLQAGAISAIELNTARLALIRAQADLADAERQLAETRPRLATALGLPVAAIEGVDFHLELNAPNTAEDLTTSQMRRLALLGRADILGALADYAASQSALQLEVAKQYPDVHLSPGYSWNAGSTGEHDWQLGATLELPLLNRHRGPIAEASARREASAARFRALQAKVIGEIDVAVGSFRASRTNTAALEDLTTAQAAQLRSTQAQLQAGALNQLDVLAAELELNSTELARLDAQLKLQQAVGGLENAMQRPFELPQSLFESTRTDAP